MSTIVDTPRVEVVAIVTRAYQLGFCHSRVANALQVSRREQALIEEQIGSGEHHTHAAER